MSKRVFVAVAGAMLTLHSVATPLTFDANGRTEFMTVVPNTDGQIDRWTFALPQRSLVTVSVWPSGPAWYHIDDATLESESFGIRLEDEAMPGHPRFLSWSLLEEDIPAGNYSLKISGHTRRCVEGYYSGMVAVTPVPEPSTWALLLAGLAGIGLISRRRIY